MSSPKRSVTAPTSFLLISDAVAALLTAGPGAAALAASLVYIRWIWSGPWMPLWALGAPVVFVATFLATLFLLRLCTPKLRAGKFPIGLNLGMVGWYCNLALGRAAAAWGLKDALHSFYLLRYLYYKSLGAKMAFHINAAQSICLVDAAMVTIERGCTLGEGVMISCHTFTGDKLIIRPVTVERNVFLGKDTLLGPGTRIGAESWIGLGNRMAGNRLPQNTVVRDFEWEHGRPSTTRTHKPQGVDA